MTLPLCPDCSGSGSTPRLVRHDDGCPIGVGLDRMREADRAWFADHPAERHLVRDPVPADWSVATLACVRIRAARPTVIVRRMTEGARARYLPDCRVDSSTLSGRWLLGMSGVTPAGRWTPLSGLVIVDQDPAEVTS